MMRALCTGWILSVLWGGVAEASCLAPQPSLIFASCAGTSQTELILLEPGEGVPDARQTGTELMVTGAYTSGEKVEPEGFVLIRGEAFDPYVQGWDGLLLLDSDGVLSLAHVERVPLADRVYNMREREERRAFVETAAEAGYSAIQSHLLIVDGEVDVSEQPAAPRFRRRIVFSDTEGNFGIYDSAPRTQTLFEAATEVAARFRPEMAFNLDMGSYDFCALTVDGLEVPCGTLDRMQTGKLSNVLVFRQN